MQLVTIAVLFMVLPLLMACSPSAGGDKISVSKFTEVGSWRQTKMTRLSPEGELQEKDFTAMDMVWTFSQDGKMTMSMKGKTIQEGTWEMKDELQKSKDGVDYKLLDIKYANQHERMQVREISDRGVEMVKITGNNPEQYPTVYFEPAG